MIQVTTEIEIDAPIDVCFDMARNIDIHTQTVWKHTREKAVAGTTRGMIGKGGTVTFEATHFGIRQQLASRVGEYRRPYLFVDEMISGAFQSMKHEHIFKEAGDRTVMRDVLRFEAPYGFVGRIVERLILKPYMTKFLQDRNENLKRLIEAQFGGTSV